MVGWEPFLFDWGAAGPNNVVKGITETVVISEQRARIKTTARLVATQTISISEGFPEPPRSKTTQRLVTETLEHPAPASFTTESFTDASFGSISEVVIRISGRIRTIPQTVLINESSSRVKTGTKAIGIEVIEPTIIVSDLIARLSGKTRIYIESATPPAAYEDISFTATSYETLSRQIIDTVAFEKPTGVTKTVTETVTIGEAVARLETKIRTAIETELIAELAENINAKIRELTEDMPELEELLTSEVESSAIQRTKSLIEDETIAEDILSQAEKARTITETELVTDLLQGYKNGIPMQVEAVPTPDITNIIGAREFYVRPQERRPPRFEYAVENTVYAPLKVLARLDNRIITPIKPRYRIANNTNTPGLQIQDSNKGLAHTSLLTLSHPNSIRLPLRLPQEPKILASKLKLSGTPTQQAIEPRRIINIERKYRTLKAYLLLHMIETLD